MLAVSDPRYTLEEYLARERVAPYKNEFYRGRMVERPSCSPRHNAVSGNIAAIGDLRGRNLRSRRPCSL